jgi:hypothetical protein
LAQQNAGQIADLRRFRWKKEAGCGGQTQGRPPVKLFSVLWRQRREFAQCAGVARLQDMNELLVGANPLAVLEHLRIGADPQHGAILFQRIAPDFAVAHVEENGAVVGRFGALNFPQI